MKKNALIVASLCCVVVLLVSGSLFAGMNSRGIQVVVPFAFTLSDRTMPAGTYMVRQINSAGLILVQSNDGKSQVYAAVSPGKKVESTYAAGLVFNRYGEEYFLAKVWAPGENGSIQFNESKQERELAAKGTNATAKNNQAVEKILVAAKLSDESF